MFYNAYLYIPTKYVNACARKFILQKLNKILIFIPKVKENVHPSKILSGAKNKLHMWMKTKKEVWKSFPELENWMQKEFVVAWQVFSDVTILCWEHYYNSQKVSRGTYKKLMKSTMLFRKSPEKCMYIFGKISFNSLSKNWCNAFRISL